MRKTIPGCYIDVGACCCRHQRNQVDLGDEQDAGKEGIEKNKKTTHSQGWEIGSAL